MNQVITRQQFKQLKAQGVPMHVVRGNDEKVWVLCNQKLNK